MTLRLAVLAAALVLAVGSPAHAQRMERDDPVGDVFRMGEAGGTRMSGTLENTDATRVVLDHRRTRFVTSVTYDSVSGAGFEEIFLGEEVRTSAGDRFHVFVRLDYHLRHATLSLYAVPGNGYEVPCSAVSATVDRDQRRVRWVIPTSCLGSPAWLQVRAYAGSVTENVVEFADNLLTEGTPGGRWSPRLQAG